MAIDFPNSPTLNQDYTVGTTTWTYDGAKWVLKTYNSLHAVPVTAMMLWANTTYPTGWLLADGSAISRTTYSDLFTAIGTTYGVGDGSTTFNIPSMPSAGSGSPNTIIKVTNSGALEPSAISHAANHTEGGSDVVTITGNQITGYQSPRNNIINGAFNVDQRNAGASQTFTSGAALAYSIDRWYGYCTGANVTGARVAGAAPFQYYYRFTGAASNATIGFGTRLEAADTYHLSGQTCRLSAYLASSTLTTVTWNAYYASTTDSFGTVASPTRTSIATGTFTITSSVTRYTASVSVPAAATTGIEVVFTTGALAAAATLTFGGVQLEKGSVATPFEFEPFETTLRKCQRYYEKSYNVDVVPGTNTAQGAFFVTSSTHVDSTIGYMVQFKVTKRGVPDMLGWTLSGTANTFSFSRSGTSGTGGASFYSTGTSAVDAYVGAGAAWVVATIQGHWTASAEL